MRFFQLILPPVRHTFLHIFARVGWVEARNPSATACCNGGCLMGVAALDPSYAVTDPAPRLRVAAYCTLQKSENGDGFGL
jgi:hypothetical protein